MTLVYNNTLTNAVPVPLPLFEGAVDVIQQLDDEPNDAGGLSAQELKAKFDETGAALRDYLNGALIPALLAGELTDDARYAAESERMVNEAERVENEELRIAGEAVRAANERARSSFGPYDAQRAYVPGEKAVWQGSSYLCLRACAGIAPSDTAYWLLIAAKGEASAGNFLRVVTGAYGAPGSYGLDKEGALTLAANDTEIQPGDLLIESATGRMYRARSAAYRHTAKSVTVYVIDAEDTGAVFRGAKGDAGDTGPAGTDGFSVMPVRPTGSGESLDSTTAAGGATLHFADWYNIKPGDTLLDSSTGALYRLNSQEIVPRGTGNYEITLQTTRLGGTLRGPAGPEGPRGRSLYTIDQYDIFGTREGGGYYVVPPSLRTAENDLLLLKPGYDIYTVTETGNTDLGLTCVIAVPTGESLRGPAGAKGDKGDPFTYADFTEEQLDNLRSDISGMVPTSRKVNGKALSRDITLRYGDVAAAPGGYGLGEYASGPESTDLGAAGYARNGWYAVGAAGGYSPGLPFGDGLLRTSAAAAGTCCQELMGFSSGAPFHRLAVRSAYGGEWTPWEHVNPPMTRNAEYRTVFRDQGYPLYCKLIETSCPSSGTKRFTITDDTTARISGFEAWFFVGTSGLYAVPLIVGGTIYGTFHIERDASAGLVGVITANHSALADYSLRVIARYRKTGDLVR